MKRSFSLSALFFAGMIFWGLLFTACGDSVAPQSAVTRADGLGRTVQTPVSPERLLSISPNITETLFALGAGDRVVGRTDYDNFPPECLFLPSVGGGINPNLEILAALEPDLVFVNGLPAENPIFHDLERLGIPVMGYNPQSLPEIHAMIASVGAAVGCETEAEGLSDSMHRVEASVRRTAEGLPHSPRVFVEVQSDPLIGAAPGSFLGSLVAAAGGANILPSNGPNYPMIDEEFVITAQPEVVLLLDITHRTDLSRRPGWEDLPAVRNGCILSGNADGANDLFLRSGPRVVQGLQRISEVTARAAFSIP